MGDADVAALEGHIDAGEAELPALASFILPGGALVAAHLHHGRTVCRRAERLVVGLQREGEASEAAVRWLNRMSDLLFVLSRVANARAGVEEIAWQSD